jgi:hypothetical protein
VKPNPDPLGCGIICLTGAGSKVIGKKYLTLDKLSLHNKINITYLQLSDFYESALLKIFCLYLLVQEQHEIKKKVKSLDKKSMFFSQKKPEPDLDNISVHPHNCSLHSIDREKEGILIGVTPRNVITRLIPT